MKYDLKYLLIFYLFNILLIYQINKFKIMTNIGNSSGTGGSGHRVETTINPVRHIRIPRLAFNPSNTEHQEIVRNELFKAIHAAVLVHFESMTIFTSKKILQNIPNIGIRKNSEHLINFTSDILNKPNTLDIAIINALNNPKNQRFYDTFVNTIIEDQHNTRYLNLIIRDNNNRRSRNNHSIIEYGMDAVEHLTDNSAHISNVKKHVIQELSTLVSKEIDKHFGQRQ
jgi:hypothetical protein